MQSKENEPITYTVAKCVCASPLCTVSVSFCVCTNMHVRMCLDKIKTGPKE